MPIQVAVLAPLAALFVARGAFGESPQAAFAAENEVAMSRMMTGMDIKPSGDIDRDFAAMMIPHHQGAIDMAVAELRYGRNEQLRRIAQEIVIEQQQEIEAMRLALHQPLPPSAPAPTGGDAPPNRDIAAAQASTARLSATATKEARK
jgi:hypothetical protein